MPCWGVGRWLSHAGCISQDTYLLYFTYDLLERQFENLFCFLVSGTKNTQISQNDPEIPNLEFENHGFLENQVFLPTEQAGKNKCWMICQDINVSACSVGRKTYCPNSTLCNVSDCNARFSYAGGMRVIAMQCVPMKCNVSDCSARYTYAGAMRVIAIQCVPIQVHCKWLQCNVFLWSAI